ESKLRLDLFAMTAVAVRGRGARGDAADPAQRFARVGEKRPLSGLGADACRGDDIEAAHANEAFRHDLGVRAKPQLLEVALDVHDSIEIALAEPGAPVDDGAEDVERHEGRLHVPGLTRHRGSGNGRTR